MNKKQWIAQFLLIIFVVFFSMFGGIFLFDLTGDIWIANLMTAVFALIFLAFGIKIFGKYL